MTGIDILLNNLAVEIAQKLPYIEKSYGRAQIFREKWGTEALVEVPKVHIGNGEYVYCLPDDTSQAQSYFIASGNEKYATFDRFQLGGINRQYAFTFWGSLGKNTVPSSLEEIKFGIIQILQNKSFISSIDEYADEGYKKVFPEFSYWLGLKSAKRGSEIREIDTQWLMYPNAGFRLLFTTNYVQPC